MKNLWNNPKMLYMISAILFIISFIFCAIINFGFILVELIGVLFVIIMAVYFNSWKFFSIEQFSKVLLVAVAIGFVLTIIALIIEGPDVSIGWQEEWHKCYNCNGSGCSRCGGVGGYYD